MYNAPYPAFARTVYKLPPRWYQAWLDADAWVKYTEQIFSIYAKPYLVAVRLVGQLRSTFPNSRRRGILRTSSSGLVVIALIVVNVVAYLSRCILTFNHRQGVSADTRNMLHPQQVEVLSSVRFNGGLYCNSTLACCFLGRKLSKFKRAEPKQTLHPPTQRFCPSREGVRIYLLTRDHIPRNVSA